MNSPKARSDAWDATLTDAQRWQAYDQFRQVPWYSMSAWVAEQFAIPAPSRSALYRWAARMRQDESARRVEQAVTARDEVGTLAKKAGQTDDALIEAYKTMAADIALRTGDSKEAERLTNMALNIGAAVAKRTELELKARAQQTKDETLRLAREKFEAAERRLAAVRDAVADAKGKGGLTEESLRKIEEAAKLL